MKMNDKDEEQRKNSILMLLNIIKKNNKDSNVQKNLDTIEERIKSKK